MRIMRLKGNKKATTALTGILIGAVNGLFGAGGGMVAVPMLKKSGMPQKRAHANAVAIILPITAVSALLYMLRGDVTLSGAWPFIPTGVLGAVIGTFCLKKIPSVWLGRIFGGFMVYAGLRLLLR